jgi:hypothetical protein
MTVAKAIEAIPRNKLVAQNNHAVVRRASIFVGATDCAQQGFIAKHFGEEENHSMIKGLAERYRGEITVETPQ